MVQHDVAIYHCQKCGKVANREHTDDPPACCGEEMAVAVAHVRYVDDQERPGTTDDVIAKSHHPPDAPR